MSLLELLCHVDDFWQAFVTQWEQEQLQSGEKCRRRDGQLCGSEIMTILIYFHIFRQRDFKTFYTQFVQVQLRGEFPNLVSYNRFVELMPSVLVPLCAYLRYCYGDCSGVSFIDSTPLAVCHNRRIARHRMFKDVAQRGKNSVDWFFGFKLHLVVNDRGQLLACRLTAGNVDDRAPVPQLTRWLWGKLFGDKGYLSQPLTEQLLQRGLHLVTRLKSKMKNRLILLTDKLLLRKRSILETIIDQLKNISQIEHTRHRSMANFMVNIVCGLIAYSHQPTKPSLALDLPQLEALIPNSGFIDNEPVASARINYPMNSQFASLWGVGTLEGYRGRGIYTALLATRMEEAIQRGRRFLTIDASPMSRPIVEKLGFAAISTSTPCNWQRKTPTES